MMPNLFDQFLVVLKTFGLWLAALLLFLSGCLSGGCALFKPNTDPIERGMNTMVAEVIRPAVEKMSGELSARSAQLQGQGSLINPGYRVKGFATFGPATTFEFEVSTIGVSANLAAAGQADAGQPGVVPPPVMRGPNP